MKNEKLENLRHSAAHLLAAAVMRLWPDTKRTIGPVIDDGFYYDFKFTEPLSEDDLPKIEKTMRSIVQTWKEFERHEVTADEALKEYKNNKFKQELINEFASQGETLTIYQSGDFRDLCRGGHCENPAKELKHFKLMSIAGAYWRGSEKNPMLTRVYGTAFETKEELNTYLAMKEEAKKRDHRKLGKEMDLFSFSPLVGSGLPLYSQRGALIRRLLNGYVEEMQSTEGYQQVWTPQIAKADLFKISGHYDKYKNDMFRVMSTYSKEELFLKPMNCPQHTQIYASRPRSYKDLPIRMTDFAMLYRDEQPGELNGLARVRSFSQDDCHIFCREEDVDAEIDRALTMTKVIMDTFGFTYRYRLSTRDPKQPERYLGDPAVWDRVEKWAVKIMQRNRIAYFDGVGEAAFYAPKMDLMATDALGREWQLSTVQIDFVMPERFDLKYVNAQGKEERPVMIHRAILGSTERFMMILLEHYAGALPLWLSPIQVRIASVGKDHQKFCHDLSVKFQNESIRTDVDDNNETIGNKIRKASHEKVPYTLVIGDKEMQSGKLAVRIRGAQKIVEMESKAFIDRLKKSISERASALDL